MEGVVPPVLAPKPEKLPNFGGAPGCWMHYINVRGVEVRKGLGVGTYGSAWRACKCNGRASSLRKTPYPTRAVRELELKEARGPAMKGRTPALTALTPWLLGNLFELPVEIIQ